MITDSESKAFTNNFLFDQTSKLKKDGNKIDLLKPNITIKLILIVL